MHRQLASAKTGEQYSRAAVLSKNLGSERLFLSHEIIASGNRSSAPHFHREADEIAYVVSGEILAVEEGKPHRLGPGDSVCFTANSGKNHFLCNDSSAEAVVLLIRAGRVGSDAVFG